MEFPKINGATPNGANPNGAIPNGSDIITTGSEHGRAALLLVESLMHLLVSKRVISREDFIEIVEDAADAECELVDAQRSSPSDFNGSLLYPLASAFRQELGR